jgi:8-oxo-dGTP pyrophosphatase MutT (NUDIX family)
MTDPAPADTLFARLSAIEPVPLRLAASLLVLRDSDDGIEVLMVVRNKAMEFASGAMVYPGGKMMESDLPAGMGDRLAGHAGLDDREAGLRVAAIREAFEEVGLLPGGRAAAGLAGDADLVPISPRRRAIDRGEADFADVLRGADLTVDVSGLVRFAHIVAPSITPKRFDTHFYAVAAPAGQTAVADGTEITEIVWATPAAAFRLGDSGARQVMFPTRMVLRRLAQFPTVAAALAGSRAQPPQPLQPRLAMQDGIVGLATTAIPGFPATWEDIDALSGTRKRPSRV